VNPRSLILLKVIEIMASKRSDVADEAIKDVAPVEAQKEEVKETVAQDAVEGQKKEEPETKKGSKTKAETEKQEKIPAHILGILKKYPGYEELYVDNKGGVFTTKTQLHLRQHATLYKNPHFSE